MYEDIDLLILSPLRSDENDKQFLSGKIYNISPYPGGTGKFHCALFCLYSENN